MGKRGKKTKPRGGKTVSGRGGLDAERPESHQVEPAAVELLKLNLGGGDVQIAGFINVDRKTDQEVFPLRFADNSCVEVRASHILEHFSHKDSVTVLKDWARVLAPGGLIKIAVPDVDKIIAGYQGGSEDPHEAYLFGAHADNNDCHMSMWNSGKLASAMALAGLVAVQPWEDAVPDCAALPVSLNLQGRKPGGDVDKIVKTSHAVLPMKVQAVISVPRLGFMDHMFCCYRALVPLGIELRRHMGAFWPMCIEMGINGALAEGVDAVLALDYDTIFTQKNVLDLVNLMAAHPEVDALAPVQLHQTGERSLWTRKDSQFQNLPIIPGEEFAGELMPINTAHFGCTLIRAEAIKALPHPWFHSIPALDGTWSEARTDADIYFWRQFEKAQKKLFMATRVAVGHAALMIRWPDEEMKGSIYQPPADFDKDGPPANVWKGTRK